MEPNLRDKAMSWLRVLNENFRLQPESFVLAVHIFDKFLLKTKVSTYILEIHNYTDYIVIHIKELCKTYGLSKT